MSPVPPLRSLCLALCLKLSLVVFIWRASHIFPGSVLGSFYKLVSFFVMLWVPSYFFLLLFIWGQVFFKIVFIIIFCLFKEVSHVLSCDRFLSSLSFLHFSSLIPSIHLSVSFLTVSLLLWLRFLSSLPFVPYTNYFLSSLPSIPLFSRSFLTVPPLHLIGSLLNISSSSSFSSPSLCKTRSRSPTHWLGCVVAPRNIRNMAIWGSSKVRFYQDSQAHHHLKMTRQPLF